MMERIPRFVNSRIKNFVFSVEIFSSEKCCTVMHEAIVAELHPQDQSFLPGSAVSLHQKPQKKRKRGPSRERFKQKRVDRVNESRKKSKQEWENVKQKERWNKGHYVFWDTTHPPTPSFVPASKSPEASRATQLKSCLDSIVWQLLKSHWRSESYSAGPGQTRSYGLFYAPHTCTLISTHVMSAIDSTVVSFLCCRPEQGYQSVNNKAPCQSQ